MNNKSFCSAPWVHLHVTNDGKAYPCCQTPLEDRFSVGNVKANSLFEIMNSDKMKELRRGMMKGEELPESCQRCKSKEAHNLNSMRIGFNEEWYDASLEDINMTHEDGTLARFNLKYWDFRFSNFCNLACTTCGPLFSTKWNPIWKQIYPTASKHLDSLVDLNDAKEFWKSIEEGIPSVKRIHFAGGEPVIMPEHAKVMRLLEQNNRYDVNLLYSTNATTFINKDVDYIELWKKFENVHLSLSIDGVGKSFEYTRFHGVWDTTFENLKRVRDSGIRYWIHPTVSILNIFRLPEIHRTLHDEGILKMDGWYTNYWSEVFHLNLLFTPDYLSLTSLLPELKEKVADQLTRYGAKFEAETGVSKAGLQSVIDFMYGKDTSHLFYKGMAHLKKLDGIRGSDFIDVNPEFKSYYDAVSVDKAKK